MFGTILVTSVPAGRLRLFLLATSWNVKGQIPIFLGFYDMSPSVAIQKVTLVPTMAF